MKVSILYTRCVANRLIYIPRCGTYWPRLQHLARNNFHQVASSSQCKCQAFADTDSLFLFILPIAVAVCHVFLDAALLLIRYCDNFVFCGTQCNLWFVWCYSPLVIEHLTWHHAPPRIGCQTRPYVSDIVWELKRTNTTTATESFQTVICDYPRWFIRNYLLISKVSSCRTTQSKKWLQIWVNSWWLRWSVCLARQHWAY